MPLYTKKAIIIEAIQWDGTDESTKKILEFCKPAAFQWDEYIEIETLEGAMLASVGDYIVKGIKGEFYPLKPDIFELYHEAMH